METVACLIQAQTEAMAAQAKAAAITHLHPLSYFTGEGVTSHEDSFEHWVEKFKDRAQFAGWSSAEQLYQLKSHLDKTALEVFGMLPGPERENVTSVLEGLRKRFKPGDIEELRGLEFHHLTQESESIEQLGVRIQQLGRKAFPSIVGKD